MKILVAEDEQISRQLIGKFLKKWGYEVLMSTDGVECYKMLIASNVQFLILDWMMPKMDGIQLIKEIRSRSWPGYMYIMLITAKSELSDIIEGFEAGADDYLSKPFYPEELHKRIKVGERIILLENDLKEKIAKLEESLAEIKTLEGLLPICMYCKNVRNDKNFWIRVEDYVSERSKAKFSHGVCPDCYEKYFNKGKETK